MTHTTLRITVEIKIDNDLFNISDEEEKAWMENEILVGNGSLLLHSNEIGDTVGEVNKVMKIEWLTNQTNNNE